MADSRNNELKKTVETTQDEDLVLYNIIRRFHESPPQATPIITLAERFLRCDKQAENNLLRRLTTLNELDRNILTRWIKDKHPIYLNQPANSILLPREITFVGMLHYHRIGVVVNEQELFARSQCAVLQNDPMARLYLGLAYQYALGTRKDIHLAKLHFTEAEKNGCLAATNALGILMENEFREPSAAFAFYQKAAEQNPLTLVNLGLCYRLGYGVAQDLQKGFTLVAEGVANGAHRTDSLGKMYEDGKGTSRHSGRAAICYRNHLKIKENSKLSQLFWKTSSNPFSCVDYQTLLALREDSDIKLALQERYKTHLPYSPKIIELLFSLPIEILEQADSLDHNDVERIAITWNVLMSLGFVADDYTNILLDYLFPVREIVNQIKLSETVAKAYVATLSIFSAAQRAARKDAEEYKTSYQKAFTPPS